MVSCRQEIKGIPIRMIDFILASPPKLTLKYQIRVQLNARWYTQYCYSIFSVSLFSYHSSYLITLISYSLI